MTQPMVPAPGGTPVKTNGLGMAGFIVSLVAILTGFILSPIALLLCLIALFKRPRGFAFAGLLISLVGTAILAAWLAFFGFIGLACFNFGRAPVVTSMAMESAHKKIDIYRATHGGVIPDPVTGTELISPDRDGWGHPLHYIPKAFGHEIRSDGPDGVPGTEDDLSRSYD